MGEIYIGKPSSKLENWCKKEYGATVAVTVSPEGYGTVTGAGSYVKGAVATLSATPASGKAFEKWSDENTTNPRNLTINSDVSLTANFKDDTPQTYKSGVWNFSYDSSPENIFTLTLSEEGTDSGPNTWQLQGSSAPIIVIYTTIDIGSSAGTGWLATDSGFENIKKVGEIGQNLTTIHLDENNTTFTWSAS